MQGSSRRRVSNDFFLAIFKDEEAGRLRGYKRVQFILKQEVKSMRRLKNVRDINALMAAVRNCKGDVILRSADGSEEFNLKSKLSEYIAIGRLCEEDGDSWEVFCMDKGDEGELLKFFYAIAK